MGFFPPPSVVCEVLRQDMQAGGAVVARASQESGSRHRPSISNMLLVPITPPITTHVTIVPVVDLVSSCSFVCYRLGLLISNFVGLHRRFGLDFEISLRSSAVG
ncbi:hypothetical protein V6N12_065314 [Hibiscus sabdariffa]|uniref:Uncharacterized protein n=1 Tax=Hibiscus sabdariffa TaxID=183260 RepID=A0ABR2G8C1_9ROSI